MVGANIRRLRLQQGMSQHDLAEKAGIRPPTLCRIETGQSYGRGKTIEKIARALGVPVAELWKDKEVV